MFRIDHPTAVAAKPTPEAAGTPGFFTKGDPVGGIPATVVTDDWANSIQEELISILAAAEIEPDKAQTDQVLNALRAMGLDRKIATAAQAQALTDDTTIITPKKLGDAMNAHVLGMGQSWQDVTSSRASGVTYTNTTGRPIFVSIVQGLGGNGAIGELFVDGVLVARVEIPQVAASGEKATLSAVVPAGSTYQHTDLGGGVASWAELR